MKKWIVLILSVVMVLGLAACGSRQNGSDESLSRNESQSNETETTKATEPSQQEDESSSETSMGTQDDSNSETSAKTPEVFGGKTLVVYYSASGNTEEVANYIASAMDGDLFEIVPTEIYTGADLDWTDEDSRVSREHDNEDERNVPLVSDTVDNWDEYDTVFIGYPNWWGDLPMPVYTFLEGYDFSGKTIIPFVTHGGSGFSDTRNTISGLQPGADISENTLSLSRNDVAESEAEIRQWAESLNLKSDTEGVSAGTENMQTEDNKTNLSGIVPDELEYIPAEYQSPSEHPGTLEKLTYQTWESFSYEERTQELTKEAWVYLPYGYSEEQKYNVFYLSHGGWSNETTVMGTDQNPRSFKYVIDHAIEDGKIQPLIIVLPTYNNTSGRDSGNYSLALQLTDQFHNELVNDLIPAVESKYSTYAEDTTQEGLKSSRSHRGFGGFSMGSVNTWCTFRYALDYFRYFMPMSGSYSTDGEYMAELVKESGHGPDDFFIFAASGTDDFAYSAFKAQIMAMGNVSDGTFQFADNEADGNLSFLEREGYVHDATASDEYTYNGLRFFWNGEQ